MHQLQAQLSSIQQILSSASAFTPSAVHNTCTPRPSTCPLETPRAGIPDSCEQLQPYSIDENVASLAYTSSTSRSNYAIALAKDLFTFEERLTSNCRGIGKAPLQPSKLLTIKMESFEKYPVDSSRENLGSAITELRNALDAHCRGLKKKVKVANISK